MKNSKSGKEWVEILKNNPTAADQCEWETLDGHDWEILLEWQSQFADRCPWEKFTTQDWSMLLHVHPEFAEKYHCPWEKFTSWDWAELLDHCPQFIDHCDLSKLDGDELYLIFSNQPTLIRKELIPQLGKRLVDFMCDYTEYISDYAHLVAAEAVIREIREIFDEEYHIWTEVQVMSMFSPDEAYIAKAICINAEKGIYQDIFFRDGDSIVQADAEGKTINETLVKLYACVRDCWREDFSLDFDPPSRKL